VVRVELQQQREAQLRGSVLGIDQHPLVVEQVQCSTSSSRSIDDRQPRRIVDRGPTSPQAATPHHAANRRNGGC
jgi:hypothetical protein